MECDTVDECFFGGYAEHFRHYPFNEVVCDNWHLYAVELCLRIRRTGNRVFICETDMIHTSTGTISHKYCRNLNRLCREYKAEYDTIYTTCSTCKTKLIPRCLYLAKRVIPIVAYVLGQEWVIYVSGYVVVFNILCWTYGVRMFDNEGKPDLKKIILKFSSP